MVIIPLDQQRYAANKRILIAQDVGVSQSLRRLCQILRRLQYLPVAGQTGGGRDGLPLSQYREDHIARPLDGFG